MAVGVADLHDGILLGSIPNLQLKEGRLLQLGQERRTNPSHTTRRRSIRGNPRLVTTPATPLNMRWELTSASELIPQPMNRQNELGMARDWLDLLPKPRHMNIHRARGRHCVIAPDFVEELFARQSGTAM